MYHKLIILFIGLSILISCSYTPSEKVESEASLDINGKYILVEGNSFYSSFDFKGKSTVSIHSFGIDYVTSYIRDNEYLRIETEPFNLLLKIDSKNSITGEGFAYGLYLKECMLLDTANLENLSIIAALKKDYITTERNKENSAVKKSDNNFIFKENDSFNKDKSKIGEGKEQQHQIEAEKKSKAEEYQKKAPAIKDKIAGAFGFGSTERYNQDDAAEGSGNQGSQFSNSDHGANDGVGYGFSLEERSCNVFPTPSYIAKIEGKIVVDITVNPKGDVISASIGRGTNIDNASMRKSALDAARRAKFNSISGANNQSGTITYLYKLK